ncbi:MAG: tetratricopeptide repeat protein [Proteobacteria bacterium]|nr:tetratricopeptide repeat protein [Pseudomonadota bacterium]MDA1023179.1 tetratricopeptide repeat protein [Pseudomonadota bacterium]
MPPGSLEEAFTQAAADYQRGDLKAAEKKLLKLQKQHPDIPDVLHLLALIALQTERPKKAVGFLQKATKAAPSADLFNLLGSALKRDARGGDAIKAFENAIALAPDLAEAHYNLGNVLSIEGRPDDAAESYNKARQLAPDFADAHYKYAGVLGKLGRLEEAIDAYRDVIGLKPGDADAHYNLANALRKSGHAEDAAGHYRAAIEITPAHAEAHNNLGEVLQDACEFDAAIDHYREALKHKPDLAEIHNNLGNALEKSGDTAQAMESLKRAIAINPAYADAHTNLGLAQESAMLFEDAMRSHRKAVDIDPDNADAHSNLGLALLSEGKLKEGWEEFEWRWQNRDNDKMRDFTQAPWQGEPSKGKTILVISEQGVGDEVMFAGQVQDLLHAGAKVVLECEARLMPVFERSFPDIECIIKADPPATTGRTDIDFCVAGASLGRWLRPDADAYPDRAAYLRADAARRDALREKYKDGTKDLLVGLAWNSLNVKIGPRKSLLLSALSPLTEIPSVRFFDLQYGDTAAERNAFENKTGVQVFHDPDIDQLRDLESFAAQVAAMDLLISVSTTAVHFAGALGVPAWVMLNTVPLSCWLREGDTSHLYPSVRLYRQAKPGEWAGVVERVAKDLKDFKPA